MGSKAVFARSANLCGHAGFAAPYLAGARTLWCGARRRRGSETEARLAVHFDKGSGSVRYAYMIRMSSTQVIVITRIHASLVDTYL